MSTRPGQIKKEFDVKATRPRDKADSVLYHLEDRIMQTLADELEKVVKEEMGDEYSLKKDSVSRSVADSMGGGI
jgi:NitT/TauT family transport system ATP-binding protein